MMDELNAIKRELKCWESMFERKHGRRPNKDDIKNASDEIRDTYVKYKHLKEESIKKKEKGNTEEEDDGVFGKKLNRKFEVKLPLAPVRLKNDWANLKPVRLCHGQRPKTKECPADNKKDDTENKTEDKNDDKDMETLGLNPVSFSNPAKTPRLNHTPSQITSSARKTPATSQSRLKRRASLFAASLKKIENQVEVDTSIVKDTVQEDLNVLVREKSPNRKNSDEPIVKKNSSSQNNQEDSNSLLSEARDSLHADSISEKRSKSADMTMGKEMLSSDDENFVKRSRTEAVSNENHSSHFIDSCTSVSSNRGMDMSFPACLNKSPTPDEPVKSQSTKNTSTEHISTEVELEELKPLSEAENTKKRRGRSAEIGNTSHTNKRADEQDFEKSCVKEKTRKRKADLEGAEDVKVPDLKKIRSEELDEDSDMNTDYGCEEEQDSHSDEGPQETFEEAKVKSSTKGRTSSGNLVRDNFVRLDMKHKSYRRRGHGMTGSAYKRQAWNNVMKARGEYVSKSSFSRRGAGGCGRGKGSRSTGMTGTCFKCGQEGHWAKNCKGKPTIAARELPDEDDDKEELFCEDDDFIQELTLEKAAQMAAGITVDEDAMDDGTPNCNLVVLPHHLPRPFYVPPPPPEAIEPLFDTVDGKIRDTPKEVYAALGQLGFSTFRSGQKEAIMRILSGVSSLVVLSTGAGKSLCYQLPAYMYYERSPCITLVISPLVSLMEDQVGGLPFGLKGACLHTNQTKAQRDKILENIVSGQIAVLLLSPEALVGSGSRGGCLPSTTRLPPIAFACIDEAHCLSEWSHNFRPSYLRVCKVLRERFGVRCFLGLTATATCATASSVALHLGISNDEGAVIRGAAVPPNLYLSVSRDRDRDKALIELLQGPRFSKCESIIIYCTRRDVTERVATLVRTCLQHMTPTDMHSLDDDEKSTKKTKKKRSKKKAPKAALTWEAESYHAGMSAAQRRRVQKRFMSGELRVVVATVAFGMGLDKSDVRAIIHYNMPKSFESYVQEIGRAGRDGLPSHCHVFLDREGKDMCELRRHIHSNTVDRIIVKKLVNKLFPRCQCKQLYRNQKERELQRLVAKKQSVSNEHDDFISDDILSQISEEHMINGPGNPLQGNDMSKPKITSEDTTQENDLLKSVLDEGCLHQVNDVLETTADLVPQGNDLLETTADLANPDQEQLINNQTAEQICGSDSESNSLESKGNTIPTATERNDVTHDDSKSEETDNFCKLPCQRICGGHDVAMPTESLVQELDMSEESIATLLCYLELHKNRWLEVLQPIRATCTMKFYGGHAHMKAVAKRIPPIAAALVHSQKSERRFKKQSSLVFPVVEIADKMGWDLDPVFKELRALQWNSSLAPDTNMSSSGQSGILVEFSDNSMHVRSPGDLTDEERDEVCDVLDDRIQAEEQTQLKRLTMLYSSLKKVSCSEYWQCSEEVDKDSDKELKSLIKAYFDDRNNATLKELEALKKRRENDTSGTESTLEEDVNWDGISRDIRTLTNIHHDQSFTGRAVARIFHGIGSPCYPAEVWGRDRRFWRKHLDVDFNSVRRYAIRELLKLR